MEWQAKWEEPLQSYLQRFDGLLGDVRTRRRFQASIKGILAAGTLICQRITVCSAELSRAKDGAQRILRLATGGEYEALAGGCGAPDGARGRGAAPANPGPE